jgi:hypothetical protein
LSHLFLDIVFPLALSQTGKTVLHASAILAPHGAVAFLGDSGSGKSTLAMSFLIEGHPLLSDDYFVLEESEGNIQLIPSYPGVRVWGDTLSHWLESQPRSKPVAHYTEKKRINGSSGGSFSFSSNPTRPLAIYVLSGPSCDTNDKITFSQLNPKEAFIGLLKHSFRLNFQDSTAMAAEFQQVTALARHPVFFGLSYPRDFTLLPQVRQALLEHQMILKRVQA